MLGDVSGSLADLGVLVPIVAALVTKNGFDAATILVFVGALYIAAGLWFRVPVPVQPIKAAAAIAIAKGLAPSTLSAAGLLLGFFLVAAGATRLSSLLDRLFTKPIVRGVQLGVGLILVKTALHIDAHATAATYVVAAAVALAVIAAQRLPVVPVVLAIVAGGLGYSLLIAHRHIAVHAVAWHPHPLGGLRASTLASALVLLVIPQLPLTFGNAVVALSDLEHRYFGRRAVRVTPTSVSLSCGIANIAAGAFGGMPMCHGSGGLTAHFRAGARTNRMNFAIGGSLLLVGLVFGPAALAIFALIPSAVLMGLLVFTGLTHATLVSDQRGSDLAVSALMGIVGVITGNLAISLALGLVVIWTSRGARLVRSST